MLCWVEIRWSLSRFGRFVGKTVSRDSDGGLLGCFVGLENAGLLVSLDVLCDCILKISVTNFAPPPSKEGGGLRSRSFCVCLEQLF